MPTGGTARTCLTPGSGATKSEGDRDDRLEAKKGRTAAGPDKRKTQDGEAGVDQRPRIQCGARDHGACVDQRPRIHSVTEDQNVASKMQGASGGSRAGWANLEPGEESADVESEPEEGAELEEKRQDRSSQVSGMEVDDEFDEIASCAPEGESKPARVAERPRGGVVVLRQHRHVGRGAGAGVLA